MHEAGCSVEGVLVGFKDSFSVEFEVSLFIRRFSCLIDFGLPTNDLVAITLKF